jgi:hypothetical protein
VREILPDKHQMNFAKPALYGTALWGVGVLFINLTETHLFSNNTSPGISALLFALSIPVAFVTVKAMPLLRICAKSDVMRSTVIGLGTAATLDGLALTFTPRIYGTQENLRAGAWILFVSGFTLLSALF